MATWPVKIIATSHQSIISRAFVGFLHVSGDSVGRFVGGPTTLL